jgi:HlyD family secretion protein
MLLLVPTLVALAACARRETPGPIRLTGRLEAPTVDLAPKVTGRVVEVRVKEGDRVKAGDLLMTLDLGETRMAVDRDRSGLAAAEARYSDMASGSRAAEIQAAQADVEDKRSARDLARRELERQESLLVKKVATPRDVDRAKTDAERTEAALKASLERLDLLKQGFRKQVTEQARSEMERAKVVLAQSVSVAKESELRAPADAVVLHRLAEPGQLLGPGQPGLTLGFSSRLYVRTFIPETKLGKVRSGQAATVKVDAYPGRIFPAHVTDISPDPEFTPKLVETKEERVNLVYGAKVDLDAGWNANLVPGQPADVEIAVETAEAPAGDQAK